MGNGIGKDIVAFGDTMHDGVEILKGVGEVAVGGLSLGLISSPAAGVKTIETNYNKLKKDIPATEGYSSAAPPPLTATAKVEAANTADLSSGAHWWAASNSGVKSAYSGDMSHITKPSSLMSISDPNTRAAIAKTRGKARSAVNAQGRANDVNAHPALASNFA